MTTNDMLMTCRSLSRFVRIRATLQRDWQLARLVVATERCLTWARGMFVLPISIAMIFVSFNNTKCGYPLCVKFALVAIAIECGFVVNLFVCVSLIRRQMYAWIERSRRRAWHDSHWLVAESTQYACVCVCLFWLWLRLFGRYFFMIAQKHISSLGAGRE